MNKRIHFLDNYNPLFSHSFIILSTSSTVQPSTNLVARNSSSEIILGDKYQPTDIENLSDEELRATRFVDGWTDEEIERIIKEWEKRGL